MNRSVIISIVLLIITSLVFGHVSRFDFVNYDDSVHVYQNSYLNPATPAKVWQLWKMPFLPSRVLEQGESPEPYEQLYAPLTYTAWALIAQAARLSQPRTTPDLEQHTLNPTPFHTANLLFHIGNTLLVWMLLRLLLRRDEAESGSILTDFAAATGALLFALHPLQVETVAWITQLNTALSGFFALLALWQYLLYAQAHTTQVSEGGPHQSTRIRYITATICFALALLAKPSVAVIPLFALVLARWKFRLNWRLLLTTLAPWLLLSLICVLINRSMQPELDPKAIAPLWARPVIVGNALAFYVEKLVWPNNLVTHYDRPTQWVLKQSWAYWVWLVPVAVGIVAWLLRHRKPEVGLACLLFVFGTLPTLGFIPYYYHVYSIVADRYVYLAMLGPAFLVAVVAARVLRAATNFSGARKTLSCTTLGLTAVWLALLGFKTIEQTGHWRNSTALWSSLIEVNPKSEAGYTNLADSLLQNREYSRAIEYYRRALSFKPENPLMHSNLADALAIAGQPEQAIQLYRQALQIEPKMTKARVNLANILREQGQTAEAIALYEEALRNQPNSFNAHYNLALTLDQQGNSAPAIPHFAKALQINRNDAEAHNAFALALAKTQRLDEAITQWRQAVQLDPQLADARINLGTALAMQGELDEAISQWQIALKINSDNAQLHYNLGQALAQQGQQDAAISHWKTALRLKPDYEEARRALSSAAK